MTEFHEAINELVEATHKMDIVRGHKVNHPTLSSKVWCDMFKCYRAYVVVERIDPEPDECCESCRFIRRQECFRYAPKESVGGRPKGVVIIDTHSHWCGDYEGKEKDE